MREQDIRQAVNGYSRETSGHPFVDYGDDIKITVNDDCTIYECIVETQYEERSAQEKSRPYKGWDVAPRKYFSIHDVSVWGYNLKTPDHFTDKKTFVEVEGSARVENCGSCRGRGRSSCPTCGGNAKELCPVCHGNYNHLTCSTCGGSGYVICPTCNGRTEIYCDKCGGKGQIRRKRSVQKYVYDYSRQQNELKYVDEEYMETCQACHGRGHWRCGTCRDTLEKRGYVRCRTCGNMGYVSCRNCSQGYIVCKTCYGKGDLVCSSCQGEGRSEFRYIVNRTLEHGTLRSYVCDRRVRQFAEDYDLAYDSVDFSLRDAALSEELYPENVRCSSALGKLVAKAAPDEGRILFQEATVQHVESAYLEYDFNGNHYTGVVCGGVFYPDGSPIEEWSAGLMEDAEQKMKRGSSATTLKMLDLAQEAGADASKIQELRTKAYDKLDKIHSAGVSTAFWMSVLLLTPILFNFYSKLNPVAPWAIVTNNPVWGFYGMVPLCQTIIYIGALLLLRARFVSVSETAHFKSHGSIWTYFAKGFGGFLLASIGAILGLIAVNYLGLSVITSFILGVIITVVAFVIALAYLIVHWIVGIFH